MPSYAELEVVTNFTFLAGGSHPEELVATAKALGLAAIAVTDRNTLAGVVRAHIAAKEAGIKFIVGARLDLQDAPSLLAYPTDRAAYGRLCRLLTLGQRRAEKGQCTLFLDDVAAHAEGLIFIVLPPDLHAEERIARCASRSMRPTSPLPNPMSSPGLTGRSSNHGSLGDEGQDLLDARLRGHDKGDFEVQLRRIKQALGPKTPLYLAARHSYRGDDRALIAALAELGRRTGLPLVATNAVLYHAPHRRALQDVLTCIREKCTIADAGFRLAVNAERHLKAPDEIARLFARHPDAIARTVQIAEACGFSLDELRYEYPDEPIPPGKTAQQHLEDLTWAGARKRYPKDRFPNGIPEEVKKTIEEEFALIARRDYARYFLTVHDVVAYARSRGILCQGRGSAANSAACYALGITEVDPARMSMLF
jgi:error-prone DNA polymerase